MITVYFIRGEEKIPVQVDEGMTLMEAERDFDSLSINRRNTSRLFWLLCVWITCHVLIDRNWTHIVGQPNLDSA